MNCAVRIALNFHSHPLGTRYRFAQANFDNAIRNIFSTLFYLMSSNQVFFDRSIRSVDCYRVHCYYSQAERNAPLFTKEYNFALRPCVHVFVTFTVGNQLLFLSRLQTNHCIISYDSMMMMMMVWYGMAVLWYAKSTLYTEKSQQGSKEKTRHGGGPSTLTLLCRGECEKEYKLIIC